MSAMWDNQGAGTSSTIADTIADGHQGASPTLVAVRMSGGTSSMTDEQWRPIAKLEGLYEVSDLGRVRRLPRRMKDGRALPGRILALHDSGGYLAVRVFPERRDLMVRKAVHHLVLEAFVGPRTIGMEGCHNDGDVSNNRLSNLRWDTRAANAEDSRAHGTMPRGELHGRSKLTEDQVRDIRRRVASGASDADTARKFGVDKALVRRIRLRRVWAWLP